MSFIYFGNKLINLAYEDFGEDEKNALDWVMILEKKLK